MLFVYGGIQERFPGGIFMQNGRIQHLTQQTMGKNMRACFSECQDQIRTKGKSTKTYGDGNKNTILRFRQKNGHVEVKKTTFISGGFAGDSMYIIH